MKNIRDYASIIIAMWLATGAAVCLAVFLTERILPLWFFTMPIVGGYATIAEISKGKKD